MKRVPLGALVVVVTLCLGALPGLLSATIRDLQSQNAVGWLWAALLLVCTALALACGHRIDTLTGSREKAETRWTRLRR